MRTKVVLLIILFITASSAAGAQVSYDRKAGSLSATYHGAPLRDVLAEISRKTGIAVYIDPAVDKTVFIEKKNRPVDEVLNEIITPLNNMLIYRGNAVIAVKVYEQVPADAMQIVSPARQQNAASAVPQDSGYAAQAAQRPEQDRLREGRRKKLEERKAERQRGKTPAYRGMGVLE